MGGPEEILQRIATTLRLSATEPRRHYAPPRLGRHVAYVAAGDQVKRHRLLRRGRCFYCRTKNRKSKLANSSGNGAPGGALHTKVAPSNSRELRPEREPRLTMERSGNRSPSIRLILRAVLLRRDGRFSFWKSPHVNRSTARHRMHHPYAMVAGTAAVFRLERASAFEGQCL